MFGFGRIRILVGLGALVAACQAGSQPAAHSAANSELFEPRPSDWRTVVGIVDDVAQQGVREGRRGAQYFPAAQTEDTSNVASSAAFVRNVTFAVRTTRYTNGEHTTTFPKQAFALLHTRYPKSKWAAKTPYWY